MSTDGDRYGLRGVSNLELVHSPNHSDERLMLLQVDALKLLLPNLQSVDLGTMGTQEGDDEDDIFKIRFGDKFRKWTGIDNVKVELFASYLHTRRENPSLDGV